MNEIGNAVKYGFTVKQIEEKLNVNKKTVQRAINKLNCDSTVSVGKGE